MATLTVPKPYEKNRLPDEFAQISVTVVSGGVAIPTSSVIFVPDRDIFIEHIYITADSDATTTSDTNFTILKAASGTAIASGTDITAEYDIGSGGGAQLTANTPLELTITNSAASVDAGQQIGYASAESLAGITWMNVTIRYRTRFPK